MLSNEEKSIISKVLPVMVRAHLHYEELKENEHLLEDNESLIDTALGTDGLFVREQNTITIALAGSNELIDWVVNIGKAADNTGIHDGFAKTANLLWLLVIKKLLPQLKTVSSEELINTAKNFDWHHNNLTINCVGYSNGAAIANLLAYRLCYSGFKNINLITLGEPSEYNKLARDLRVDLLNNYIQISHPLDPVTYVPIALSKVPGRKIIKTGGWYWFPHNFQQYVSETAKLLTQ